jgi:hypothetical protein
MKEASMDLDFDAVLRFAKTLEGRDLYTQVQHRRFRVRVIGKKLEYTLENKNPKEKSIPRIQGGKVAQKVLNLYNVTRSLRPGDYNKITVHASYLLTIVAMLAGSEDHHA